MTEKKPAPKPAPLETDPGEQQDDNLDDLGNKPGGDKQDQPTKRDEDRKR
jgi:hypothetical protein